MSWLSDIKLLLKDIEVRKNLGDSTSKFNITKNVDDITYTYSTGTKPDFSQLMLGLKLCINAEDFSAVNNVERALIKAFTLEFFTIENSSGSAESDKAIGNGYIQLLTQRVSDEQYLIWANQAIDIVNNAADTSYEALTETSSITDVALLSVINEYVQCKRGQKIASDAAEGFSYNDGITAVDKKKTSEQLKAAADIHCIAYKEALKNFLATLGISSSFNTGEFIRS